MFEFVISIMIHSIQIETSPRLSNLYLMGLNTKQTENFHSHSHITEKSKADFCETGHNHNEEVQNSVNIMMMKY